MFTIKGPLIVKYGETNTVTPSSSDLAGRARADVIEECAASGCGALLELCPQDIKFWYRTGDKGQMYVSTGWQCPHCSTLNVNTYPATQVPAVEKTRRRIPGTKIAVVEISA